MKSIALLTFLLLGGCKVASSPSHTTRASIPSKGCNEVRTLAQKSYQTLMEPSILAGEHVEALYLSWDDVFRAMNDAKLLECIAALPREAQGSIARFLTNPEEKSRSHPKVMAILQKTRITSSPALTITAQDAAKE